MLHPIHAKSYVNAKRQETRRQKTTASPHLTGAARHVKENGKKQPITKLDAGCKYHPNHPRFFQKYNSSSYSTTSSNPVRETRLLSSAANFTFSSPRPPTKPNLNLLHHSPTHPHTSKKTTARRLSIRVPDQQHAADEQPTVRHMPTNPLVPLIPQAVLHKTYTYSIRNAMHTPRAHSRENERVCT